MMALATALLLAAGGPEAPACQREAVVEVFHLIATGIGTIADRARLMADQEENEWALVGCALFPELATKEEATPEQDRAIYDVVLRSPKNHKSEILAYLRYKWPALFTKTIRVSDVSAPKLLRDPATIEYAVAVSGQEIRVRFEPDSCRILSIVLPSGIGALGEIDCLWRLKARDGNGKGTAAPGRARRPGKAPPGNAPVQEQ